MDTIRTSSNEKCSSCGKEWTQLWHGKIGDHPPKDGTLGLCVCCSLKIAEMLTGQLIPCSRCQSNQPPIAKFTIQEPFIGRAQRLTIGLCNPCLLFIVEGMTIKLMEMENGTEEAEVRVDRNDNQPQT